MLKNTLISFGLVSKILHWLMAVIAISLLVLGLWMVELSYYSDWYRTAPFLHESFGMVFILLLIFQFLSRLIQVKPNALESHRAWEINLARIVKFLLYLLMLSIVVSGLLISLADYRGMSVFGMFQVKPFFEAFSGQEDLAGAVHRYAAYVLIGSISLHAIGALKHHFIDKDNTLKRML